MGYNNKKLPKSSKAMTAENISQNIALTITFNDPELTAAERNEQAVWLLEELQNNRDIEKVERVRDPNPPQGNKSAGGFLIGVLTAEISGMCFQKVCQSLHSRLSKKVLSIKVEVDGVKMEVEASNPQELLACLREAEAFIERHKRNIIRN